MKHFRILEQKLEKSEYTIEYTKELFFGIHIWKKLNTEKYFKYEDALSVVRSIMIPSDYENDSVMYHYVDAYKIFKTQGKEVKPKKQKKII